VVAKQGCSRPADRERADIEIDSGSFGQQLQHRRTADPDPATARALIDDGYSRTEFLLEQSPLSISELAFATGFSSASHFSRAFKEHFGLTPKSARAGIRTG
jgi:AraC-like DNA-binding protein